jgi:hypothetical protein
VVVLVEQVVFLAAHHAPEPYTPKLLVVVAARVATKPVLLAVAAVAVAAPALLEEQV